jgi:hypothetical protein
VNIRYFLPYRLHITHGQRSSLVFGLLSSLAFCLGLYLSLGVSFLTRLTCERRFHHVECQWQSVKLLSSQSQTFTFVQQAFPTPIRSVPTLYQLHLKTTRTVRRLPLSTTLHRASLKTQAQQINQFLQVDPSSDPSPSTPDRLEMQWDRRWLGYGAGSLIGAIGFIGLLRALLCPLIYECRVDHRRRLITVEYRGLIRHCITHYHLLRNLRSVQVHCSDWDDQVYVRLLLSPGEFIVLRMSGRDRLETAEAIATFMMNP